MCSKEVPNSERARHITLMKRKWPGMKNYFIRAFSVEIHGG
jgi:hypothetical protein